MPKAQEPKFKKIVDAADGLSLGISVVAAILIGVAIGYGLVKLTGAKWTMAIGVFIGISAAINNLYIAYKKQKRALDAIARDPKHNPKLRGEARED